MSMIDSYKVLGVDVLDGEFHFGVIASSFAAWLGVHYALHFVALALFPWYRAKTPRDRTVAASYFLSTAHAVFAVGVTTWAFFAVFDDDFIWAQNMYTKYWPQLALIQHISLGYFYFDAFMMLVVAPKTVGYFAFSG